ncbi:MAG: hypothetical protein DCC43_07230 [Candidatus Brocadia sp.]|nr:hypothetical protein [Candidatus Brocadia sp. AMX3]OQY98559.1 MAG: hypothetical protein B6D35_11705 [Candidatus Brocadia sp. UTAMX2]RIK00358.1 MAG: hypothetical protein DCC43_07230 [Candidatus Brocadia sp.]
MKRGVGCLSTTPLSPISFLDQRNYQIITVFYSGFPEKLLFPTFFCLTDVIHLLHHTRCGNGL